jgi:hypothetical protein
VTGPSKQAAPQPGQPVAAPSTEAAKKKRRDEWQENKTN